jgi:hypothetical protein
MKNESFKKKKMCETKKKYVGIIVGINVRVKKK